MNNSRTRAEKARNKKSRQMPTKRSRKTSRQTDKKKYINSLAEEAKEAAYSGNMKQLYDTHQEAER